MEVSWKSIGALQLTAANPEVRRSKRNRGRRVFFFLTDGSGGSGWNKHRVIDSKYPLNIVSRRVPRFALFLAQRSGRAPMPSLNVLEHSSVWVCTRCNLADSYPPYTIRKRLRKRNGLPCFEHHSVESGGSGRAYCRRLQRPDCTRLHKPAPRFPRCSRSGSRRSSAAGFHRSAAAKSSLQPTRRRGSDCTGCTRFVTWESRVLPTRDQLNAYKSIKKDAHDP